MASEGVNNWHSLNTNSMPWHPWVLHIGRASAAERAC
jgi:hypothetical protein